MARHSMFAGVLWVGLISPAWADEVSDAQVMIRARDYAGAAAVLSVGQQTPEAALLLASLYRSGKGVGRDDVRARALTLTAAQGGLADAQYAMARMAMDGIGGPPDPAAARVWAEAAVVQGHAKAADLLVTLAMMPMAEGGQMPEIQPQAPPKQVSALGQALGQTALMEAASLGRSAMVAALLAEGVALDGRDPAGRTALMFAAEAGAKAVVSLLLEAGADPALRDLTGNAALDLAAAADRADTAARLVDAGADPLEARPVTGRSPLGAALLAGHCQTAAAIVPLPAPGDVDLARIAARTCDGPVLTSVLGHEALMADPDRPDAQGRTLTWLAASTANLSALSTVLQAGGDPARPDGQMVPPIKAAALASGGAQAVAALIAAGAAVDGGADAPDGNTALILAAGRGEVATVQALIAAGAELDHRNALGESAMMAAARAGSFTVVSDLLATGADPDLRNFRREQAADIARNAGHVALLALFP